jgi:hypothetical protein
MRKPCLDCTRKHLAQAEVLMNESLRGYPSHRWLAIGHLAEAEEELLGISLEVANEIRNHRLEYMTNEDYKINCLDIIEKLSSLKEDIETADGIDKLMEKEEIEFNVEFSEKQFNSKK